VIAIVFSLLIPGIGHVFMGRFGRALIWLGGALAIGLIFREAPEQRELLYAMQGALAVFAAIDISLLIRSEGRTGRR
jgi:hypothetical protein